VLCWVVRERVRERRDGVPWNKNKPTMLEARPSEPTMTISFGLEISTTAVSAKDTSERTDERGVSKNLPIASRDMEKHRARRKTPFTRAARISALCQP
jgi:hypothetical protein